MENTNNYTLLKQHNVITQAKYSMSALEMDVFFALLSVLDEKDRTSKYYKVEVKDLEEVAGKTFHSTRLREVTDSLMNRVYTLTSLSQKNGDYLQINLLSSARYVSDKRKLIMRVNPEMEEYLFDLKSNFTLYYLEYALSLNSKFSKRIYQILSQFRSTGFFKITIKKLKEQLELYDSKTGKELYQKVSAFRRYVLDVAQKELMDTDINFEYELIKSGRAYKAIVFKFESEPVKPGGKKADSTKKPKIDMFMGAKPVPTLHPEEQQAKGRTLYERMSTDFKLSHEHIIAIFNSFSIKVINKALYDIKLNINDGKVSNKEAYTRKWFENLLTSR